MAIIEIHYCCTCLECVSLVLTALYARQIFFNQGSGGIVLVPELYPDALGAVVFGILWCDPYNSPRQGDAPGFIHQSQNYEYSITDRTGYPGGDEQATVFNEWHVGRIQDIRIPDTDRQHATPD